MLISSHGMIFYDRDRVIIIIDIRIIHPGVGDSVGVGVGADGSVCSSSRSAMTRPAPS